MSADNNTPATTSVPTTQPSVNGDAKTAPSQNGASGTVPKIAMVLRPDESRPLNAYETKVYEKIREKLGKKIDELKFPYSAVLRFVRGFHTEKPDPEAKTLEMLEAALKWREENKVDEIRVTDYPRAQEFKEQWPVGFHGVGKLGHPIYVERPGLCDPDKLFKKFTFEEFKTFHIQTMDRLCELKENITKESGELCYKHIVILDLEGIGMSHLGKKFYGPMKQLINIDQYFYPETLHTMIITNSSWVFKALWAICSPWIDPLTKQRIQWGKEALEKHIDKENIPQFLKGSCKCQDKKCLYNPFVSGHAKTDASSTSAGGERKSIVDNKTDDGKASAGASTTGNASSTQAQQQQQQQQSGSGSSADGSKANGSAAPSTSS